MNNRTETGERSTSSPPRSSSVNKMAGFSWAFWNTYPKTSLFLLALLVRLIFIVTRMHRPGFAIPIVDEIEFDKMARLFSSSLRFAPGPLFRPPLWPGLLGVLYIMVGPVFPVARLVNALFGALSVVSAYRLGLKLFDRSTSYYAAVILSFYGMLVFFNTTGLATTLLIFLSLEALITGLKARQSTSWRSWIGAGLLWGLAALARPVALLPAAVIAVYLLIIRKNEEGLSGLKRFLVFSSGVLIMVSPVSFYNLLQGDFALVSTNGGINLYLGNNASATGFTASHPAYGVYWTPKDIHQYAEKKVGHPLTPTGVSSFYAREAVRFWVFHPGKALKLFAKKTILSFNRIEIGNNGDISFFANHNPFLKLLMFIGFGLIVPFGIAGMILCWNRGLEYRVIILVAATYFFIAILFFVASRFRLPAIPILAPFAVYTGRIILEYRRNRRWKKLALLSFLIVICGLFVNVNSLGMSEGDTSYGYFLEGQVLAREGKYDEALDSFHKALETYEYVPLANYYIAHIYLKRGDAEKAVEYCKREIEYYPGKLPYIDLGKAYRLLGRRSEAEDAFEQAYLYDPKDWEVRTLLAQEIGERGIAAGDQGNWEESKELFLEASLIDYRNPFYGFGVASATYALGDTLKAGEIIKDVLTRHPDFVPALEWKNGWRPDVEGESAKLIMPGEPEPVQERKKSQE